MNIEELQKRTIQILEKTRKNSEKYGEERKKLDQYLRNGEQNKEEWEKYLIYFEQILKEKI